MSFNIKTKKILSEENCKRIIALGISLKDSISALENKCIEDYDATKTYAKNTLVIYNGYIYKTKTVTTGDFDENKFEKIGDHLDLLTLGDIKAMINLSDEEIANLQSLILDSSIELSHVWSSSKTYTEIQNAIKKGEEFTLSKLASTMTASFEIANSTDNMTEANILYLLNTGTNTYDIYALINDVPTVIASTTIDLSGYVKIADLEDNYYDKATSDGKYATITTVDGKVDKTSILSAISSTPSDDKLLSEKAINDTLVKKTDIDNKVDKADIVSVLDSTVTNKQLVDGKTLVDKFNSIEDNLSRRYNFDDKKSASIVDRKLAIKAVIDSLKKDGTTDSSVDYYGNNLVFLIRYNGGYYYSYIMTSYMSKVFIQEYSPYGDDMIFWLEDEMGELYIRGTIPMVKDTIRIVNPFTTNKDKYKLYEGKYTIDENTKTCTLTVSIDCLSPAVASTDVGLLANLNFKIPSSPRTFDLQAENDSTSTIKFYLGESYCQVWQGTAGKRYTGTVTYTVK